MWGGRVMRKGTYLFVLGVEGGVFLGSRAPNTPLLLLPSGRGCLGVENLRFHPSVLDLPPIPPNKPTRASNRSHPHVIDRMPNAMTDKLPVRLSRIGRHCRPFTSQADNCAAEPRTAAIPVLLIRTGKASQPLTAKSLPYL